MQGLSMNIPEVKIQDDQTIASMYTRFVVHGDDVGLTSSAATAIWRGIDASLLAILGQRGVYALFNRSVRNNRADFPWLGTVEERTPDSPGLVSLQMALSHQSRFVIAAANAALLRDFRLDLVELIGEPLCDTLLRKASEWSESGQSGSAGNPGPPCAAVTPAQLTRVNEGLVLAALRAADKADNALRKLSDLDRSSHRDPLTDTPNRALFLDRLQSAIAMARRRGSRLALLFIDLDDFKTINDTFGHPLGDAVLKLVAQRLTKAVRKSDSVTRYGGDEFLILLSEISTAADVELIRREIIATLALPADIDGHHLRLSASVGISLYPDHGEDADVLIGRADSAMYRAKRARRRA